MTICKYPSRINGKHTSAFLTWTRIKTRCYNTNTQLTNPAYIGCSVHTEWLNFQNFAKWFEDNHIEGFAVDKDILIKGNKIYGPETCCFVPKEINNLFVRPLKTKCDSSIGVEKRGSRFRVRFRQEGKNIHFGHYDTIEEAFSVYKKEKELHIKNVANQWKSYISENVYNAMINYQITITN